MSGLFVGLTTLDLIYLSPRIPDSNQKIVAQDQIITAGGPATNSAIAFHHFGHSTQLLSVSGQHPLTTLVRNDLSDCGIQHCDLAPSRLDPPAISSIIVTQNTGERAVISLNAKNTQISAETIPKDILAGVKILLIDGHQREVSEVLARAAKVQGIPVVMDGGSWKPNLEKILPQVDYAICSANFYPPQCTTTAEVFAYLAAQGIPYRAITQGNQPLLYQSPQGAGVITPPSIQAVDTLGAGDILHGAFCHFLLQDDFAASLEAAAQIASYSCEFFGPRRWLEAK